MTFGELNDSSVPFSHSIPSSDQDMDRQMIIAENLEKVGHHELHAAHAEEERRLLQRQLMRRITQVFQSSFLQEFLPMSSEFTFGDNSDKSSIFEIFFL